MSGYHSTDIANMENNRNCLRRIARHDEQQFSKDSLVNVMEKFVKTVNIMDETILVPCRLMDRQVGDSTDIIQAPAKTSASHHQQQLNSQNGTNRNRTKTIHEVLSSADLFNLYSMLNSLKNDLLWTRSNDVIDEGNDDTYGNGTVSNSSSTTTLIEQDNNTLDEQKPTNVTAPTTITSVNTTSGQNVKGHNRRPSTASMASSNSVSNLSDSESEISNENDSGIESEGNCGGSQKSESSSSSSSSQGNIDKATELARQCRQHLSGLHRCLEQMTEAANYLSARYQSEV